MDKILMWWKLDGGRLLEGNLNADIVWEIYLFSSITL